MEATEMDAQTWTISVCPVCGIRLWDDGYRDPDCGHKEPIVDIEVAPVSHEPHVWIRWDRKDPRGGSWVCGDEDGEFARSDQIAVLMPYVDQLIRGPGTIRSVGLRPRMAP